MVFKCLSLSDLLHRLRSVCPPGGCWVRGGAQPTASPGCPGEIQAGEQETLAQGRRSHGRRAVGAGRGREGGWGRGRRKGGRRAGRREDPSASPDAGPPPPLGLRLPGNAPSRSPQPPRMCTEQTQIPLFLQQVPKASALFVANCKFQEARLLNRGLRAGGQVLK